MSYQLIKDEVHRAQVLLHEGDHASALARIRCAITLGMTSLDFHWLTTFTEREKLRAEQRRQDTEAER